LKAVGKSFWLSETLTFIFDILQSAQVVESRAIKEILAIIERGCLGDLIKVGRDSIEPF